MRGMERASERCGFRFGVPARLVGRPGRSPWPVGGSRVLCQLTYLVEVTMDTPDFAFVGPPLEHLAQLLLQGLAGVFS